MSFDNRLKKLESRHAATNKYRLLDGHGKVEEAEIIQMPRKGSDGLAKLADGSQVRVVVTDGIEINPSDDRLYLQKGKGAIFIKLPEGINPDMI